MGWQENISCWKKKLKNQCDLLASLILIISPKQIIDSSLKKQNKKQTNKQFIDF